MRFTNYAMSVGAALFLALSADAQVAVGEECVVDTACITGCCGLQMPTPLCLAERTQGFGDYCFTSDGCDCEIGKCIGSMCTESEDEGVAVGEVCVTDTDCITGCCTSSLDPSTCSDKGTQAGGQSCNTDDGCDCDDGLCINDFCPEFACSGRSLRKVDHVDQRRRRDEADNVVCGPGTNLCDDPHMQGLRGQTIDWSGVDGGWYCLVTDGNPDLHVNVRLTAPLPEEFPDRQLVTGLSVVSEDHSLVVEVTDPYNVDTDGCPLGISPCLADGGLRVMVDGNEVVGLLRSSRHEYVAENIVVSASNLPVECREFGGDKIWAKMYEEMLQGGRQLVIEESFEDWILRFDHMAAPDWCSQYIAQHNLAELQSNHAIFKIETSAVTVRLNVGTNYQGNGEIDWDGRVLPDLEFWQMDVGLHGLSLESESLSGILGETARPVLDKDGHGVMNGYDAFRGTVEDYRVSGALGTDFALLKKA